MGLRAHPVTLGASRSLLGTYSARKCRVEGGLAGPPTDLGTDRDHLGPGRPDPTPTAYGIPDSVLPGLTLAVAPDPIGNGTFRSIWPESQGVPRTSISNKCP
jgi:hypothetical protein